MEIVRKACPADHAALYQICLATADAGHSAAQVGRDPDLYGHLYAGPYLALEAGFAWVADDAQGVCGYVLATPDSAGFYARMEADWLPPLRHRHVQPAHPLDRGLVESLHQRWQLPASLAAWPAHLHINLLPRAQGRGLGERLMRTALAALDAAGAGAVHLGVDPRNQRALAWYGRFGFGELARQPGCIWLVRAAPPA